MANHIIYFLKVLCVLSILSGTQFIYFTLLGFIAHNPVLRYAKEISVHRFTEKEDLITNDGGMIIEQPTQKKWWGKKPGGEGSHSPNPCRLPERNSPTRFQMHWESTCLS